MVNAVANWPTSPSYTSPLKQTAQSDSKQDDKASGTSSASSIENEFLKIARMSPEERVQKAILDKLGMSEEDFNKLDAKAKADVMAKVRDEMLQQMEANKTRDTGKTGAFADFSI